MTKILKIYTDGSCRGNGTRKAIGGIGVYVPQLELEVSRKFRFAPITNQRAELYAIHAAMMIVEILDLEDDYDKIWIYTDSEYALKCITIWMKKWEKLGITDKKNMDLIEMAYAQKQGLSKVELKKVKAHQKGNDANTKGNRKADELATNATA